MRSTGGHTRRAVVGRTATAALGVLSTSAVACGAGGTNSAINERLGTNGFTFKDPVAVTYWQSLGGASGEAQVKLTNDFNTQRADVRATLENVGAYEQASQKLIAALAGGTPPDVMMLTVDQHMPAFARQGALHPLDAYAKGDKSAQFDKYAPGFIKNGIVGGKLYQLPLARSTPILYYNKDHFRSAGMPDQPPSTWPQLLETGQRLVRAGVAQPDSADGSRAAFHASPWWWPFQSMVWTFSGRYSDEKFTTTMTQPETVQAMEFLADLAQRHRVARAYKGRGGDPQKAFIEGRISMYTGSTAGLNSVQTAASFQVGTAFMPGHKARAVPSGGSGMSILSSISQEKKEASWEYLKHMTSTPSTVLFSQASGYMVVRTDALQTPAFQKYLAENPNAKVTFDQMQYVRTQDSIVEVPQGTVTIEAAMERVLFSEVPAKTAFDDLQRELVVLAQRAGVGAAK
ncbi:MAG TPA: ABC transporter substrate-binding protein [Chloroflexota bacterium]|nr:ABC transporter substrate-binding protein [Chloroflexota bacterium]